MLRLLLSILSDLFRSRASLEAEIVALRHQVAVLKQKLGSRRVRLSRGDRLFWVGLSRLWPGWRTALIMVQPATVIRWHREGFRAYWRWKARPGGGRPRADRETRDLIARMHRENPLYVKWVDMWSRADGGSGMRRQDGPFQPEVKSSFT